LSAEHHHTHDHDQRRLIVALLLATGYMVAEAIGGWVSNSLALWADAGHMLSDSGSLALSLFALWMVRRPPTQQQTFGLARAEILAAMINGILLVGVAIGIAWEAWERWSIPHDIDVKVMAGVALGGLLVNLLMLRVLHGGHEHNLNLRGAWLHVIGDLLGSVGVLVAAACLPFGWWWADPLVSVVIALLVVASAWRLLSDAVGILMEHSPRSVDVAEVRRVLSEEPGVADVHCLHVWSLASGFHIISAHVVMQAGRDVSSALAGLRGRVQERFQVEHVTLQVEPADFCGCEEATGPTCRPVRASDSDHSTCDHAH
jgi:cobalt-zinc-cadmium efflux system protein